MKVGNEQRQIRRFGVFLMHRGLCGDVIDETQKTAICRLVQIQEESRSIQQSKRKRRKFWLMYNDIPNSQISVPKSRKESASIEDQTWLVWNIEPAFQYLEVVYGADFDKNCHQVKSKSTGLAGFGWNKWA